MEYRILGSLEAWSDGRAVALGPPKQRTVLAILLLHAGEVVPTDRLIEQAWGERAPRTAAHSLQIYVSELRKVLERSAAAPVIVTRPPGYSLLADPDVIDARRFERLVERAARDLEAADPLAAEVAIREALGLWRGPPLSDFTYEEFAQDEIRRLEALHVDALEVSAAAELALGREQAALTAVESAIAEDPLRERSRDLQIRALYRSGRHPAALRTYEAFRTLLREELGVEPSPALQRLQEQVLLHDPALGPTDGRDLAATATPVRNPYKGLRPFGEEDAGDFFGRDALVARLVDALARGIRLLALVGPSGCGKSSVLHAGLLPALRGAAIPGSDRWAIARMMPGPHPLEALDAALERAGWPARSEWWRPRERDGPAGTSPVPGASRLLLVIDQLEELFSIGEEPETARFLRDLTAAVTDPDGPVTVVLALRADFYDRPLLHAGFAPVFTAGVVNVMPMTAEDLEAAVIGPARRVGLDVDPALLARLTADTADRPAALPLLQYTLTELFERRTGAYLSLEDYRALGGLHDALSRRAEEIWARLAEDRRAVALQVFLRLVRLGDGAGLSRRRVPLRELTSLELDPVALSEVLDVFGRHRFLAFDRDRITADAIVEVAHEALLSEWGRLAGWIEGYRAELRQQATLAAAAGEWEASGRDPDYLLIGSRLDGYAAWGRDTPIRLTARERDFLDLSVARRRSEQAEEARSREDQQRLERRARRRLWGLLAAVAVLAAVATFGLLSWLGSRPPDIALLVEGTGDAAFGDMAVAGVDRAAADFNLTPPQVATAKGRTREVEAELRKLSERGTRLVVVGLGAGAEEATATVAAAYPATRYIVWENSWNLPNATNVSFRSEEAAYLAGAAAAIKSRTKIIGFIGAFKHPILDAYLSGFEAGARSIDPQIQVRTVYLAEYQDLSTVTSMQLGARAADQLYGEGADVVFAVDGTASWGAFMVADSASKAQGRQLWAIGVDTDEYQSALPPTVTVPAGEDANEWRQHILTSVTKRLDLAFHTLLGEYARGTLAPGPRSFGLAEGDVDISYSGGFIDDIRDHLEAMRAGIISGEIKVPAESTAAVGDVTP